MKKNSNDAAQKGVQDAIDDLCITHKKFDLALARFDECRTSYNGVREPTCMLLLGPSGVGKTTLMKTYRAKHRPKDKGDCWEVPVLTGTIPVPATMKNMATELLDGLGDPLADRGTLEQRTRRLRHLLPTCGTHLIVLDEFQHFIDRKSERVIMDVSDWLKNLISNTLIPVILMGMPSSRAILQANDQLHRRFSNQIELTPFPNPKGKARSEFNDILRAIDAKVASILGDTSDFSSNTERFYAATNGLISRTTKIISAAARYAEQEGQKNIRLQNLERAYREKIINVPQAENPFSAEWDGSQGPGADRRALSPLTKSKPFKKS